MQLVATDIVSDARALSAGLSAAGLAIGLALWLTGWWGHRFWIVLAATVLAGIFGLLSSPAHQVQPLIVGLLLAVAAGVLALSLVRLVAFAAGGAAVWLAVHAVAPPPWDDVLICFLAGGLVGLLLFRLWMIVLTSFAGTLLMAYSGLCLGDRLGKLDAVEWTETRALLLNWLCVGITLLGLVVQLFLERRRARYARWRETHRHGMQDDHAHGGGWWGFGGQYRRAG